MPKLPFANHPALWSEWPKPSLSLAKNVAPESLVMRLMGRTERSVVPAFILKWPVMVQSAWTKSDTIRSPLVFREILKSRKFYDPCRHEVNKVNVSFFTACAVPGWVMQAKCMAVLPSAASCSVATAIVGSCFRAALPRWPFCLEASHPQQGLLNAPPFVTLLMCCPRAGFCTCTEPFLVLLAKLQLPAFCGMLWALAHANDAPPNFQCRHLVSVVSRYPHT